MDETNQQILARHARRTANADELYMKAESRRQRADEIERQLALPDHLRPVGHEETLALEAKLLRQQAEELTRDADGILQRLHQPTDDLVRQFEDWAHDSEHTRNRDRDRGGHQR